MFIGFFHIKICGSSKETQAVDYLLAQNTIYSVVRAKTVIKEEFDEFNYFVVWRAYGRITVSFWYLRQT